MLLKLHGVRKTSGIIGTARRWTQAFSLYYFFYSDILPPAFIVGLRTWSGKSWRFFSHKIGNRRWREIIHHVVRALNEGDFAEDSSNIYPYNSYL